MGSPTIFKRAVGSASSDTLGTYSTSFHSTPLSTVTISASTAERSSGSHSHSVDTSNGDGEDNSQDSRPTSAATASTAESSSVAYPTSLSYIPTQISLASVPDPGSGRSTRFSTTALPPISSPPTSARADVTTTSSTSTDINSGQHNESGAPGSASSPHGGESSLLALVVVLPIVFVTFACGAAIYFYKARKKRHHSYPNTTFGAPYTPHNASDGLPIDGVDPPLLDTISSPSSNRHVSTHGYSTHALDGRSTLSTGASIYDAPMEKVAHPRASALPGPALDSIACASPDAHLLQHRDSHLQDASPLVSPVPPAYARQGAAARFDHLTPTSAASAPSSGSAAPLPSMTTASCDTHDIIGGLHVAQDGDGARGGQDRVLVLPWPLGERLLALLASTPQERGLGGTPTSAESETLPAYTPRE